MRLFESDTKVDVAMQAGYVGLFRPGFIFFHMTPPTFVSLVSGDPIQVSGPVAPPMNRVRFVSGFNELATAKFSDGFNAFCWKRTLPGDFAEVVSLLQVGDEVATLDEDNLLSLSISPAGRLAIEFMLEDLHRLRGLSLDPVLNRIHAYPRDEDPEVVATDVFSFHADSAPFETDTWLCTYHGAPSEGIANEHVRKKVDVPQTRAELLKLFGGGEGEEFAEFLRDNCYDLHYQLLPSTQPYSFGLGNLWRIATDWPGNPVPPCIHRAPQTQPGCPRLLLIS